MMNRFSDMAIRIATARKYSVGDIVQWDDNSDLFTHKFKIIYLGDYDDYVKTWRYKGKNLGSGKVLWLNEASLEPATYNWDSSEDIAEDVASRISAGMAHDEAFKNIGYAFLYYFTRENDMPDRWFNLPEKQMKKALTISIEKAKKRFLK